MKTNKINLDGLKNVLTPKEMKNVTGGSGPCDQDSCSGLCEGGGGSGECYMTDFGGIFTFCTCWVGKK
jgi:hypothetical protein